MRTREAATLRLISRFKDALETSIRTEIQIRIDGDRAGEIVQKRHHGANARANKLQGTIYRMIVSSPIEFEE